MTREEILEGVCASIAAVLDIQDPSTIKAEDRLVGDLGADSLDLLDFVFHLEKRFKIRINPRDIEREAQAAAGGKPIEVDGYYTPEALESLRKALPEVPPEELHDQLETKYLARVFRIETFVRLVTQMTGGENA